MHKFLKNDVGLAVASTVQPHIGHNSSLQEELWPISIQKVIRYLFESKLIEF